MPNSNRPTSPNRDPITKTPGSHPVGVGAGATAGGLAGTLAGGPIGTAAGIAVGAVVGGLAGKKIAERINPTEEDAYWREAYRTQPYYAKDSSYDDYSPAYRTGYEGYARYNGKSFDDAETELRADYERNRGKSKLAWERAKDATRAAWDRARNLVEDAIPGDSDRDGH